MSKNLKSLVNQIKKYFKNAKEADFPLPVKKKIQSLYMTGIVFEAFAVLFSIITLVSGGNILTVLFPILIGLTLIFMAYLTKVQLANSEIISIEGVCIKRNDNLLREKTKSIAFIIETEDSTISVMANGQNKSIPVIGQVVKIYVPKTATSYTDGFGITHFSNIIAYEFIAGN